MGLPIINGLGVADALASTKHFSSYDFHSIKIGEESGKLQEMLLNLSLFYGKKINQKRLLINALSYPLLVTATAICSVFFMLRFIVPMFADVFKRFNKDLPPLTKAIIKVSNFIEYNAIYVIISILLLLSFVFSQRKKEAFQRLYTSIILNFPIFGGIVRKMYISRLCKAFSFLLNAKIPLTKSIHMISDMLSFYPIKVSLLKIGEDVSKGKSLTSSMSSHSLYDNRLLAMIKVGEESGKMGEIFDELAEQYSEEVSYQTSLINGILEPTLIIFLGLVIGVILVAMYLPLFQLSLDI